MNDNDTPISLDPWLASSLLQKAIRRSDTAYALMAAEALHRHRGNGIWRRLVLICFEDIGIGDPALVERVIRLAVDRAYRQSFGTESEIISQVVTDMAAAPRDRSADYLICAAHDGRDLDEFRTWCAGLSREARMLVAADPYLPLDQRALGAWSAVTSGSAQTFSLGDPLLGLLDGFMSAGLPSGLAEITLLGTRLVRDPIVLMFPILWSAINRHKVETSVIEEELLPVRLCRGVPTYACDKHTATGKAAIRRLVIENQRVNDTIAAYVPDFKAIDVAAMAAFYADAVPVRHRLDWPQSNALQHMGLHVDMMKVGCPREGVAPIAAVVREELEALDDIRCRLLNKRPSHAQPQNQSKGEK